MKAKIKIGSSWKYTGPGDGTGVVHQVTSASDGEITTWSDPTGLGSHGWSWLGTPDDFLKHFVPAS